MWKLRLRLVMAMSLIALCTSIAYADEDEKQRLNGRNRPRSGRMRPSIAAARAPRSGQSSCQARRCKLLATPTPRAAGRFSERQQQEMGIGTDATSSECLRD
jgi:hypothetical protein